MFQRILRSSTGLSPKAKITEYPSPEQRVPTSGVVQTFYLNTELQRVQFYKPSTWNRSFCESSYVGCADYRIYSQEYSSMVMLITDVVIMQFFYNNSYQLLIVKTGEQ